MMWNSTQDLNVGTSNKTSGNLPKTIKIKKFLLVSNVLKKKKNF